MSFPSLGLKLYFFDVIGWKTAFSLGTEIFFPSQIFSIASFPEIGGVFIFLAGGTASSNSQIKLTLIIASSLLNLHG